MPEGDTVFVTARRLHAALAGSRIVRTDFRVPRYATVNLAGDSVEEVAARGKHLLIRTSSGKTIHSHLKMEGRWNVTPPGPMPAGVRHDVRLIIQTESANAVGVRLSEVEVVATRDERRLVGHLGPDPLGEWDEGEAVRRAAGYAGTISDLLLDQRVVAGFGNVYRCEICFLRGVSPWAPASSVDVRAAIALGARLLQANRETARHVTTGIDRRGQSHWVYGRDRQPCRRCGTAIRVVDVPGERRTYWCPSCQPAVETGGARRQ